METLAAVAALAAGLAIVLAGAELFFKGLLSSATRLGLPPFVVAAALSGFELENLAAGIAADANGLPGVAAGTFLGGTSFLVLAVGGLAALVAPVKATLPVAPLAWTAVSPLPLVALSLDGELSRLDGAVLMVWFVVALTALVRTGSSVSAAGQASDQRRAPGLRLVGGLAALSLGGVLLSEGLRSVVSGLGVSQTLLGNTAVAAAVEVEELARVAVPARRGRGDVAVASILGTIVHFVAFNAGVIALVRPLALDGSSLALHLPVAAAAPALLCGLLSARRRLGRAEGALLLSLYVAYVAVAVTLALSSR